MGQVLYLPGNAPVIVTAPHASEQERDGKRKFAEPDTARIAAGLNHVVGAHAVIKPEGNLNDPNWDEKSDFRDTVVRIVNHHEIRFGIDLHQMSPDRPQDVIIGTAYGRNLLGHPEYADTLVSAFRLYGLNPVVDEIFPAAGLRRVSSDVAKRAGVPYLQMEMNTRLVSGEDTRLEEALSFATQRLVTRLSVAGRG